jgi:homopolymeric O-antigen transport system permease protein
MSEAIQLIWQYRQLTWELAKREIKEIYIGSLLGAWWAMLHPLALMGLYVLVFTFVFKVRIAGSASPVDYVIYLMSGYLPWMACMTTLVKSAMSITSNAGLVKQVVFPIEILPVKAVIAALIPQMIGIGVLAVITLGFTHSLPVTYSLLPLLFIVEAFLLVGLSWPLAAVGAYFRDLKDIAQVATLFLMYMLPIFYQPAAVPSIMRPIILLNPFSHFLYMFQDALFFGRIAHPWSWALSIILAGGSFCTGYWTFQKLKIYFGNVI